MNLGVLPFKHFLNYNVFKFIYWLDNCSSPSFITHKLYFSKRSMFKHGSDKLSLENYGMRDVLSNDSDAVLTRLHFVQSSEESSLFLGL